VIGDDWRTGIASPWEPIHAPTNGVVCNICRWSGPSFEGTLHSESANCPQCGSISRDRFLFFCMQRRCPPSPGARLLETSPRMGNDYRDAMDQWFAYLCSDFDESAHRAMVKIDLQAIDLDDASIDIILTPHVLEHVPDTDRALAEIMRVLAPGGRMYLQVPVLQGATAPPETPEFHGDDTPVFWRFGFDLTARLRELGFVTSLLTTEGFEQVVRSGASDWSGETSGEFDVPDMLAGVVPGDLEVVASIDESRRHAFEPGYMFLTWECVKPV
jgi:SAM-dependent methyltransferase